VCQRDDLSWVAAAYFPRGQQSVGEIKKKFSSDAQGATAHSADAFAFITNQELTLADRSVLAESVNDLAAVEIYHLERIAGILNTPAMYGVRLEFLDIEMSKEEQLAFIADRDARLQDITIRLTGVLDALTSGNEEAIARLRSGIPLQELREFRDTLASLAGSPYSYGTSFLIGMSPSIHQLKVPLQELREFASVLREVTAGNLVFRTGHTIHDLNVPLAEIREFQEIVEQLAGGSNRLIGQTPFTRIRAELEAIEETLDRVARKIQQVPPGTK
jgi:hypothetical protein